MGVFIQAVPMQSLTVPTMELVCAQTHNTQNGSHRTATSTVENAEVTDYVFVPL